MRKALLLTLALCCLVLVGVAVPALASNQGQVTICHATASNNNPYNSISPNIGNNGDLSGGHLNHTGGIYPQDNWGDIIPPYDYTDSNGNPAHFDGMNWSAQGQAIWNNGCNVPTPPADVCPNLEGNQASVPDGYYVNEDGNCVPIQDVCPNIDGVQGTVPDGMTIDDSGNCVPIPEDVCPNIDGIQASVPDGMIVDNEGNCVPAGGQDVCPNLEGNQAEVPPGYHIDRAGNCVPNGHRPPSTPGGGEAGLGQITVWSNLPLGGVGWLKNGNIVFNDANGNGAWDNGEGIVVTPIEFRDRWNRDIDAYEKNVQMSRLVLGRNNTDTNPVDYMAFDAQRYIDTGDIVLVGVWVEYTDEHCQPEDFGSAANCGVSHYVGDVTNGYPTPQVDN